MNAASQWLSATAGRIATCAHSWLVAVHWVNELATKGFYTPKRKHGPNWGPTTLSIAQELAHLTECRPGIAYLMRKLKASERTIQYHLDMLRETGLLVYRSKGTRLPGAWLTSVFERTVPLAFDEAHGIRTVLRDENTPSYRRVPVGAALEARSQLGKLAKKAARKVRRKSARRKGRCTPMQVGTSTGSTTALTHVPSESKLASGDKESPTGRKSKRGPRKLNRIGRRHQLARELMTLMPWLRKANQQRIAWIVRHVADAEWTALEVQAIAEDAGPLTPTDVRRPSGMLAHRLKGAHLLFPTPAHRQTSVEAWKESRPAERARHEGYDDGFTGAPVSQYVKRIVSEAVRLARRLPSTDTDASFEIHEDTQPLPLEDLDRQTVIDMRAAAEADPDLIHFAISMMGEADARRLYTNQLVDRALHAARTTRHTIVHA